VTHTVARELVKRGHEVTVFTTDASRRKSRLKIQTNPVLVDGVKVYHFRNLSNQLANNKLPITPTMAFALSKYISRFDLVHVHEYRTFNAAFARYYSKKKSLPFVIQPHGSLPTAPSNLAERRLLRSAFDSAYGLSMLKDANMVIASQESEAYQCEQMGVAEHRIRVIPHAIDLQDYRDIPKKGAFRKRYGFKDEDKLILFLGRIHKVKGIDLLVESFFAISKELTEAKLVIAGPDDGFLSALKSTIQDFQISDRVTFTGPLYDRAKLEAYRDADVYVLPSRYESFGNTVLEAIVCGTPVILTDTCAIAGVFKRYGIVVEFDENSLSNALLTILEDGTKRRELTEKARSMLQKEFVFEEVVTDTETVYYETVSLSNSD
jgi:glycosyltransferase involved in cell wall biosynthesis